ncbi:MAG: MgtC/SapB family protein [Gemmatimonadota bacterium]|nr:MgtC/SapB family protein [Gemmatimonadota bacterium]
MLRLDLLAKMTVAVVCGGAIGLEREMSGKPAGLRTNILICLGAALLMDLSIRLGADITPSGGRSGDPARLAAQVVSGIGFLGAGTILQARGVVVGLTTAATIWVVSAIGLTAGAGSYVEAIGSTVLVTSVLVFLGKAERYILARRRMVQATIRVRRDVDFKTIREALADHGITVVEKEVFEHEEDRTFEVKLDGPGKLMDAAAADLKRRTGVISVQLD